MSKAFDLYHSWWMRRGDRRAWQDPTWAAIQHRREEASSPGSTVMFAEDIGLGMEEWKTQDEIWSSKNPHTLVHRLHWLLRDHGPRTQYHRLRAALARARKGYAPADVAELRSYLAELISQSVADLNATRHGYPTDLTDEGWGQILTEISEGFAAAAATDDVLLPEDELLAARAKLDRAHDLLKEHFLSLWD